TPAERGRPIQAPHLTAAASGVCRVQRPARMCSADRGARLPRSQTALMRAAEQGQLAVCKALAGPGGALPGWEGAAKALVEEAKKRGLELQQPGLPLSRLAADLNDKDQSGQTALMKAAARGHTAVVTFLLGLGADAEARDRQGDTALTLAVREGHV